MKRIMTIVGAVVALAAGGLWAASPAVAGGWAVTYLDPLPPRFEPGTPYTVGYWMLQHGTHPYVGADLGATGIRLTDAHGKTLTFTGTALPEAGHYATAITVPGGTWKVEAIQGWFAPYDLGKLTVPGQMKINPVPAELIASAPSGQEPDYWGAIHPPGFPAGKGTMSITTPSPVASVASPVVSAVARQPVQSTAAKPVEPGGIPPYALLITAIGAIALTLMAQLMIRRTAARRPEDSENQRMSGDGADTLVIGRQ